MQRGIRLPAAGLAALLMILAVSGLSRAAAEETLNAGEMAPEFSLVDQHGDTRALADYRGEWVVLYFYPKNDTPGCTTEACAFRDDYFMLRERGARVLGVSLDSAESHAAFAEKYGLPFPLLADTEGEVARAYGSLWGIWPLRFAKRHTFIVDPDGRIARIYREVKPKTHSAQVLTDLKALQGEP
jgi:peroxiredoxin Q/BCP